MVELRVCTDSDVCDRTVCKRKGTAWVTTDGYPGALRLCRQHAAEERAAQKGPN